MPQRSRWAVSIPEVSLSTYIFGSPSAAIGDDLAYIDVDDPLNLRFTWSALRLWSQRFAAGLIAAGLQHGDRLLVYSANNIFMPVLFHGTVMAGGVYSPANAKFLPPELAYQLRSSDPKFVLTSHDNLTKALEAIKMAGLQRTRMFVFDHAPLESEGGGEDDKETGVRHWKHLLTSHEVGSRFQWEEIRGQETRKRTMGLMFSSG
jgi:acyl-CoA synthetase (AMP-forming)/AMP-acid ligase II